MASIPLALQLYSVREDCGEDLPGTLKAVAEMGYVGVEFAGYHGYEAKDLRRLLDDLGLRCCGTHTGLGSVEDDQLQATIDFNKELDNPYLIAPGLPGEIREDPATWQPLAERFGAIAEKCAAQEMRVGYHNHAWEFQPIGGRVFWDTFFDHAPADVLMQFDTGNAAKGGAEAVPYLKKYAGRAETVHLKEFSATNDKALIGEGDVPWAEVFACCESNETTRWYIVEQEDYPFAPMECVRKCREALQAMGR